MRYLVFAIVLAGVLFARSVQATELVESGFADSFVAEVGPGCCGYGGVSENSNGDLYVVGGFSEDVFRIRGGTSVPIASGQHRPVSVFADGDTLVFGERGDPTPMIYVYDLASNSLTMPPIPIDSNPEDFARAPSSWGLHGGRLIVATYRALYALDESTGSLTRIGPERPNRTFSNLAFVDHENVVVTDYRNKELLLADSSGNLTPVATFPASPEAVEVDQSSGDAYVVLDNGEMHRVNISRRSYSLFATGIHVNTGLWPHPLTFANDGKTLYYGDEDEANRYVIRRITGFDSVYINLAFDSITVSDVNRNGYPEVGVSRGRDITLKDSNTGEWVHRIPFFYDGWSDLVSIGTLDSNLDGSLDVVALASNLATGRIAAEVRDPDTRFKLARVSFFVEGGWQPISITTGDVDLNGIPDIGVIARRERDGRVAAEYRKLSNGKKLGERVWFPR